ncbi:F-box/RNI-like superfamily protein [Prunus dulcis]|uniref:F-box/RNI-like superfamily protein n=1 Tax=Prunus dulcis TaxID=3755 RepID=A0A4Y1RML0_PRUDU|nr:F-box/RNI-like superfamily protein [Prunus dulcis]
MGSSGSQAYARAFLLDPLFIFIEFPFHYHLYNHSSICICNPFQIVLLHLPVEVIGNILSRLSAARDVVVASTTCQKWREACRKHLHTLSFNSNDWPVYRDLTTSQLEILITQTIFQSTGLQGLSILMDDVEEFLGSTVIAWLMYTRETLRQLFYNVRTAPNVNILEICGRQKLEMLVLGHNSVTGVEPKFQRFPCLKSLSLRYVSISALDLSLLLSACPKIETLELVNPEIAMSDAQVTVELSSPTLKSIYTERISLEKFILEADSIQRLHLKACALEDEIVDLETIAVCLPQLSHLSLSYDLRDGVLHYGLQGSSHLENVTFLELGWTLINDIFIHFVEGLLKRCPSLKKLVIHGLFQKPKPMKNAKR